MAPVPSPSPSPAPEAPVPAGVTRWVAVAVATVWRAPDRPRAIDLPALAAPAGLRQWLAVLDVEAKKDLVGRIETQVLLGQPVTVLEERDGWARVAVPEQAEPGAPGGYPGWIPSWQLTADPGWAAVLRSAGRAGTTPGAAAIPAGAGTPAGAAPPAGGGAPAASGTLAGAAAPAAASTPPSAATPTVTVSSLTAWLHHRPYVQARWMEISFGTCLPVLDGPAAEGDPQPGRGVFRPSGDAGPAGGAAEETDGWIAVAVPAPQRLTWPVQPDTPPVLHRSQPGDGHGVAVAWIRRADVRIDGPEAAGGLGEGLRPQPGPAATGSAAAHAAPAGSAPAGSLPAGSSLLATARTFLGLPYLWGGTSGFGVDCSGFMYLVHRFHGILIPRDAAPQRDHGYGEPVDREQLQPGDLVFFAHDGGKGAVHHVGMYAGGGRMIHAPSSERVVEEIPLDRPPYAEKYAGARRYHAG